ncbi:MAG: aggregation factor core [Sulfitobacter sp.]
MFRLSALALILCTSAAQADLTVRFDEGAPKDRFTLTNTGDCAVPAARVTLDLGTAPAGLIFDVTGTGAGVEVFQPFELVAGAENLNVLPTVLDGDTAIELDLRGLGQGQSVAFTIDVDDTGGGREITVSGSEIAGATVRAAMGTKTEEASFTERAQAVIPVASCTS